MDTTRYTVAIISTRMRIDLCTADELDAYLVITLVQLHFNKKRDINNTLQ